MQNLDTKGSNLPKLMLLFSPEVVSSLNFKVTDLGSWTDDDKASLLTLDMIEPIQ
jgi:hypothetical protein